MEWAWTEHVEIALITAVVSVFSVLLVQSVLARAQAQKSKAEANHTLPAQAQLTKAEAHVKDAQAERVRVDNEIALAEQYSRLAEVTETRFLKLLQEQDDRWKVRENEWRTLNEHLQAENVRQTEAAQMIEKRLMAELAAAHERIERLTQEVNELRERQKINMDTIARINVQASRWSELNQRLVQANTRLSHQLREADDEIARLRRELAEARIEIANLSQELEEVRKHAAEADQRAAFLQDEVTRLSEDLTSYKKKNGTGPLGELNA